MKHKLSRIIGMLFTDRQHFLVSIWCKLGYYLPDKIYLKVLFFFRVGYRLNLKNPRSYNEKLQWLKMNYRREEYTNYVDKFAVKDYVRSRIGDQYIIKTIGIWDNVDDIDWDSLPNSFVIKLTFDSGSVVKCLNKSFLNISETTRFFKERMKIDYSKGNREYPYKTVPRRIIAEEFLAENNEERMVECNFFCFDGFPKFVSVVSDTHSQDTRADFFDTDFNHLPCYLVVPNAEIRPSKPTNFDDMLVIATRLSEGFPHVRVDLYSVNGSIYFGEMTFFTCGGLEPFEPREWDYLFGEYLHLPQSSK